MSTPQLPLATPADGFILNPSHLHIVVQAEAIPVPNRHYPLRVLVTGPRDWNQPGAVAAALWGVSLTHGPLHVTDGAASGLDELAHQYAQVCEWSTQRVPARWRDPCRPECRHRQRAQYCAAAGNYRNQQMVDLGHDLTIGWLNPIPSSGTMDCLSRSYSAGIPTFTVQWEEADLLHESRWAVRRYKVRL